MLYTHSLVQSILTLLTSIDILVQNKHREDWMSEKKKTINEKPEELSLFLFLKEKEIEFLENVIKNGMNFIPQEERKIIIKTIGEIVEAKKKELETYQLHPLLNSH